MNNTKNPNHVNSSVNRDKNRNNKKNRKKIFTLNKNKNKEIISMIHWNFNSINNKID